MRYQLSDGFFLDCVKHTKERTVHLIAHDHDEGWNKKQEAGLDEYKHIDATGELEDIKKITYVLLKGYISSVLLEHFADRIFSTKLLDVGCGISLDYPPYIGSLAKTFVYVGLDPIDRPGDREYLFIHGKLEDFEAAFDPKTRFDVFIFSSSLDHVRDIAATAKIVRKIANPGALVIFWVWLRDHEYVAEDLGLRTYRKIYGNLHPLRFLHEWIRTCLYRLPKDFFRIRKRAVMLKKRIPIDNYHFVDFSEKELRESAALFGEIVNFTAVPGTQSCFLCCKIPA